MKNSRKLALLLLPALVAGGAMGWACEDAHPPGDAEPAVQAPREPIVRLEVAIESPDGVLEPGAYYAHPLLTEQGFTELTLSREGRVVTRFALRPAQDEPSPMTGFPVIHTEASLTGDRESVIFTVFEGPDRYVSAPFRVMAGTTP